MSATIGVGVVGTGWLRARRAPHAVLRSGALGQVRHYRALYLQDFMVRDQASRHAMGRKGRQRIEVNGTDGSAWWDMEDPNRLHVFLERDDREGLGGFRSVLVTEPDHPFVPHWWTAGAVLGWEHSFAHQWRDFLDAVLAGRPVPELQADFEDGHRAAVVVGAAAAARAWEEEE